MSDSPAEVIASLRQRLGAAEDDVRSAALQELDELDFTDVAMVNALVDSLEGLPPGWSPNREISRRIAKALIDESRRLEILAVVVTRRGVNGAMQTLYHADGYEPIGVDATGKPYTIEDRELSGPVGLQYHGQQPGPIDEAREECRRLLKDEHDLLALLNDHERSTAVREMARMGLASL